MKTAAVRLSHTSMPRRDRLVKAGLAPLNLSHGLTWTLCPISRHHRASVWRVLNPLTYGRR